MESNGTGGLLNSLERMRSTTFHMWVMCGRKVFALDSPNLDKSKITLYCIKCNFCGRKFHVSRTDLRNDPGAWRKCQAVLKKHSIDHMKSGKA